MNRNFGNNGAMFRFLAFFFVSLWYGPAVAQDTSIAHGKALVEKNCASCHAIGKSGASKLPGAPAFRTLAKNYPAIELEEALVEGIVTGHEDMPEFVATPEQAADITAFINSLNP